MWAAGSRRTAFGDSVINIYTWSPLPAVDIAIMQIAPVLWISIKYMDL